MSFKSALTCERADMTRDTPRLIVTFMICCLALAASAAPEASTFRTVVFVHGLGGDENTWKAHSGEKGWPDFAESDPALKATRSLVVRYQSDICSSGLTAPEIAKSVLLQARAAKAFDSSAVVIVAHSLGGIVARQAYLLMDDFERGRVSDIFLVASPSQGASMAAAADLLCGGRQTADLRSVNENSFLQSLNDNWDAARENAAKQRTHFPRLHCAYEINKTFLVYVVRRSDAVIGCNGPMQGFVEDHFSIAKPTSTNHQVYQWFQSHLTLDTRLLSPKEEELVTEVIAESYRRALSISFQTRFASSDDFTKVQQSISDFQTAIQRRTVSIVKGAPPRISNVVLSLGTQLDAMTATLAAIKPKVHLGARIDGSDPELHTLFCALERQRIAVLSTVGVLAEETGYKGPLIAPASLTEPASNHQITRASGMCSGID